MDLLSKLLPIHYFLTANKFYFSFHRSAKFGLLRSGEYTGVSVVHNSHTKFSKLAVGKHVVKAKQRHAEDPPFPLTVALSDLPPLSKVSVDYLPQPKNTFKFKVNDNDLYSLPTEQVDHDSSKIEELYVVLNINDL